MENSIQSYDRVSQPPERSRLFDHLVRPEQHRLRNRQADLFRRFEIDNQLEFRRLLNRNVRWLCAFQDLGDHRSHAPVAFDLLRPIGHQAAGVHENCPIVYRRQPIFCRQVHD